MVAHAAVTIRAPLRDEQRNSLDDCLSDLRRQGHAGPDLPLAELSGLHFARIFVIEESRDLRGHTIAASLVYMADVDGSASEHVRELADQGNVGVDRLFGHCLGYPATPDLAERIDWLTSHSLSPAAYYIHTVGRSLGQVRAEAQLRDVLEDLADGARPASPDADPVKVHRQLVKQARSRPDLAWTTRRAQGAGRLRAIWDRVLVVAVALGAVVALPVLLPILVLWLVAIRVREAFERPETGRADPAHVRAVLEHEDHGAQNPFTAIGLVKPGVLRPLTMRVGLAALEFGNRHLFRRDNLAGVRTIHFARWQPLDDGRTLVFASSYDGSLESYMDDFIDRLHWGINLVFSNGVGFPRTRWLIHGGAQDEVAYKNYLRRHQIATPIFYSAYPSLTARTIDTNARLREGLGSRLDRNGAARWLARL